MIHVGKEEPRVAVQGYEFKDGRRVHAFYFTVYGMSAKKAVKLIKAKLAKAKI